MSSSRRVAALYIAKHRRYIGRVAIMNEEVTEVAKVVDAVDTKQVNKEEETTQVVKEDSAEDLIRWNRVSVTLYLQTYEALILGNI